MRETTDADVRRAGLARLLGQGGSAPCVDGVERPYVDLDAAASTAALVEVAAAVNDFLPGYASIHRGAGWRSRTSTAAYEQARQTILAVAVAVAFRLELGPDDVVVTTVVEHHANLLPWRRYAKVRYVECSPEGTFEPDAVAEALRGNPRPKLFAVTGASNVSGWLPPIDALIELSHEAGVPVLVDAAQLAPHRPLPAAADYLAWSGHKMYAPFGAGALVGPRRTFAMGDPFLAGGGAVDLVSLDEVVWDAPPEREEAGSPNVVGAVAFGAAARALEVIGRPAIRAHDDRLAGRLRAGLAAVPEVRVLGPGPEGPTLPVASFVVEGVHLALVAARLAAEWGIGVRHGCFCAHPYLLRLLQMSPTETAAYRDGVRRGDHTHLPGATRASASIATTDAEIDRLLDAVHHIATGEPAPIAYEQDPATGDFYPSGGDALWAGPPALRCGCATG